MCQFNVEYEKKNIEMTVYRENLTGLIKQIRLPHHNTLAVKWLTRFLGDEFRGDRPLRKN